MQLKMFSIRDTASDVFHQPFFNHTHGEAERNFIELIKDEKSMISKYPEHFDLYFLGTYDNLTGKMSSLPAPEHLYKAIQFVPLAKDKQSHASIQLPQ